MNRTTPCITFLSALLVAVSFPTSKSSAQAIPAARRAGGDIRVGIAYTNANTDEVTKRIGGFTVYGSYGLLPHLDLEADVHLLQYFTPQDYAQRSYVAGGRFYYRRSRYEPFVKVMGGIGTTIAQLPYAESIPDVGESYGVIEFGIGADVLLPKHLVGRAEYDIQRWPAFYPSGLSPSMFSVGIAYRVR